MYVIVDEFGEFIATYDEQDRMMREAHAVLSNRSDPTDYKRYSIVYIDDNEQMHLLAYMGEQWIRDWSQSITQLEFDLLLKCGTYLMGLTEFIAYHDGIVIQYKPCDCPKTELCSTRYVVNIDDHIGEGYTRIEALGRAYLCRKEVNYGRGSQKGTNPTVHL
jgi:hypothetical protein